jgi:heme-degrading monooxygenase HmoA
MPIISAEDKILSVFNLFTTDSPDNQDFLLTEMRKIVDSAAFPGWISSTVHSGQSKPGTANLVQWRSQKDVEARYAGEKFKQLVPVFTAKTRSIKLLRTEVAFTQRHPSQGEVTEISPQRDDYTVIDLFSVPDASREDLVTALGPTQEWLLETPGYRSHSVLRGLGARGHEGAFAVMYAQWDSEKSYDTFRTLPESEWPAERRATQARLDSLASSREWNSYRVVHTRSAPRPVA